MAGFLYYIPATTAAWDPPKLLKGLEYALTPSCLRNRVARGPSEDLPAGWICAARGTMPEARLALKHHEQRWRNVPGTTAHVGYYLDDRPGPEDLARTEQLPGHLVTLHDGNQWLAPIATTWADDEQGVASMDCGLPRSLDLNADGEWVHGKIDEKHAPLWAMAMKWWAIRAGTVAKASESEATNPQVEADLSVADAFNAAVAALAANYRIWRAEVAVLGMFSMTLNCEVQAIMDALIDWKGLMELLSGKAGPVHERSSTDDGQPDVHRATDPQ